MRVYTDCSKHSNENEHRPLEQEWECPLVFVINVVTGGPCGEKVFEEKADRACNARSGLGACIPNPNRFTGPADFEEPQLTYYPAYNSSDCCG